MTIEVVVEEIEAAGTQIEAVASSSADVIQPGEPHEKEGGLQRL